MASVRALGAAFDRFDEAASRSLGIGRSDLRALNLLEHGPVTAGEMASHLGLTTGSITALVNRLVEAGYVRRSSPPGDRRVVTIELEPAVYAAFARVYAPCGQAVMEVSAALSDTQRSRSIEAIDAAASAIEQAAAQLS